MKYFEAHHVEEFKDAEGKTPEILIVDGNRTGGKTTAFSKMLVEDFLKYGKQFFLVYRYKNELLDVANAFFNDIKYLFFPEHEMTSKTHANGAYIELFIDGKTCGFASSLSMAGKIKRYSHVFSQVEQMFFDEYQDENNLYLPFEVTKLMSLHTTIARGRGQAVRFVPIYMCSNSISIFNPYYLALGITTKINSKTKVYKGVGHILLRLVIKDVAEAQRNSAFNRAFSGSDYLASSIDNSFLNDDNFNVEKRKEYGQLIFVFYYNSVIYSVYSDGDTYYVRKGGDKNASVKFGVLEKDRGDGVQAFKQTKYAMRMRYEYENANIFYETQEVKHAFQTLIS